MPCGLSDTGFGAHVTVDEGDKIAPVLCWLRHRGKLLRLRILLAVCRVYPNCLKRANLRMRLLRLMAPDFGPLSEARSLFSLMKGEEEHLVGSVNTALYLRATL